MIQPTNVLYFFFFNDTATTEIYTLSLHDALPIFVEIQHGGHAAQIHIRVKVRVNRADVAPINGLPWRIPRRSEEHTSELQSRQYLVCRLLLEKKKKLCILRHIRTINVHTTTLPDR